MSTRIGKKIKVRNIKYCVSFRPNQPGTYPVAIPFFCWHAKILKYTIFPKVLDFPGYNALVTNVAPYVNGIYRFINPYANYAAPTAVSFANSTT